MSGNFYIVGMGMSFSSLSFYSIKAIDESSILIFTSDRLLNSYKDGVNGKIDVKYFVTYKKNEIDEILKNRDKEITISLIVSGDVGFYSFANYYRDSEAIFIEGISSLSALAAHFHLDYSNFSCVSIHGREERLAISTIRRNLYSFILLSKNIQSFVDLINIYNFKNLTAYIGSDIGGKSETFCKCPVEDLKKVEGSPLCSIIIENPNYDSRVRTGIYDNFFIRADKIPMTKRSIRSMIISLLDIKPTDIIWDIGCGSGSVSVEIGLSAYEGWLYAIDIKQEAVELCRANLINAKIANASVVLNSAPNGLEEFKAPNAIFIGGSNGNLDRIIKVAVCKNPNVKIVLTAISLDTLSTALALPFNWEIINIQTSISRKIGKHQMMSGENPIYILSCGGRNE